MNIFVTGGAGYIGSHTIVELLQAGHSVVACDNLCNSSRESLRRVEKITGKKVVLGSPEATALGNILLQEEAYVQ